MASPLFAEERRRSILERLHETGRVSVRDLSEQLRVSLVTIRHDLRALEGERYLDRTHGGAVLPTPRGATPELSFDVRHRQAGSAKDLLARAAAHMVQSGDSVALDASTTVYRLLDTLFLLDSLLIVTNSLMVARQCLARAHIEVLMPGGRLRRDSMSLVGRPDHLPDIHLAVGFFGAHGVSALTGLTESSQDEVQMKQAIMARCRRVVFLVDGRKWDKVAPYTLAVDPSLQDAPILTTDDAPEAHVDAMVEVGWRVVRFGPQ